MVSGSVLIHHMSGIGEGVDGSSLSPGVPLFCYGYAMPSSPGSGQPRATR